jgi:predicted nucleotidyltransferase
MLDPQIRETARRYLRKLEEHGVSTCFAVVIGAHAHGTVRDGSDIDLLVVSRCFDGDVRQQDADLIWRVAAQIDSRIEPIPCGEQQWDEDATNARIELARCQGERIYAGAARPRR